MEDIRFDLNTDDLKILKRIIKQLESDDIDVFLFLAPYHPLYVPKISNLDSLIQEVELNSELEVVDLSNLVQQREYFADRVHTNQNGAEMIGDTLIRMISSQ